MRPIIIAIIFICIDFSMASAQDKKKVSKNEFEEKVFTKIEVEGGPDAGWMPYLQKHSKLPDSIAKTIPAGAYTVTVTFIVDRYGSIIEVKADNDPGYGLASRAVKAIKNYKGKWTPANQCGNTVKSYKMQAITYVVTVE
jgi:protein TonB